MASLRRSAWLSGLVLALVTPVPVTAQVLRNPFAILPDTVGPVDEAAAAPTYQPDLPPETPEAVQRINPATPVVTLADALTRAYWLNPQLQAERARLRSADFRLPQARGAFGPSLSYSLSLDWQRDRFESPIIGPTTRSGTTHSFAAIVNQPLYTFGRLAANERAVRGQIAFQRAVLRDAEQRVLGEAVASYVGVLRDRAALQIARDDLAILDRQLSDVNARFRVRESTAADVAQVESRVALARANLASAQAAAASSEAAFRAVIGADPGPLQPPPPLGEAAASLEDAQVLAEQENPLLSAARAREQVSRAAADGALAERLPRVDLQGRADFIPGSPYDDDNRQRSLQAGIVLSGPLFDNGVLENRQNEAEAANDADWRLIDSAMRDIRAEVISAWATRNAALDALGPLAEAVDAAQRAYDMAVIQQRAGFRTTLDVLILARDLLNVRTGYTALIADAYVAEARLLAAMGQLDPALIDPARPLFDPAEHLEQVDGHGEFLLWTPLLQAIDGMFYPPADEPRAMRDPSLVPQQ